MGDFYTKKKCRLCNNNDINIALPLGKTPICDAYSKNLKDQKFYSLNLCLCNKCGFVQIDTIVNIQNLYKENNYLKKSPLGLQNHLKNYASEVCDFLKLDYSGLTIDFLKDDETLLNLFKKKGHKVLGIDSRYEPPNNENINEIVRVPVFFDTNSAKKIVSKYGKASLITINNLLANVDNLEEFINSINELLDSDGVLVIESSYLLDMIDNLVFDFIYHEHLSYFSILPLVRFFNKFDIKLIHLDKLETKGGSLRYYWARNNSKWESSPDVKKLTLIEEEARINLKKFEDYNQRITIVKKQLLKFLKKHKESKIFGYGASATSTTLISHFELQNYVSCLVDDNIDKINTYSPGFHIPVISIDSLKSEQPDIIIILAWRFKDQILEKLSFFRGIVVLPLPIFKEIQL